jgi:hypothetical protein
MTTSETARHVAPVAGAGSGVVAVGAGTMITIVAIDPTTTIMGLLRHAIMTMTVTGRVAVVAVAVAVAVVEGPIAAVQRATLMATEADIVRLIGKDHEVGNSQHSSLP